MNDYIVDIEFEIRKDKKDLVSIPYDSDIYLCGETKTRWRLVGDDLIRDYDGEEEWQKMAAYVNKSYEEVFDEVFSYSKK